MASHKNKKKVIAALAERNLVPILNDTKWQELQEAVESELDGSYPLREKSIVRCKSPYTQVGDFFCMKGSFIVLY